jgi:hypothetical protein
LIRAIGVLALGAALAASAAEPTAEEMAKALSNPVADMASLPVQLNWENGVGPDDDLRFVMNFQPVVPFKLNPKLNMISRLILPYIQQPALTPGASPTSGTGDIVFSLFFSPSEVKNGLVWGVGPAFNLPTTTDPTLGSGQWGVGPTAVILKQSGPWTYGALVNHLVGVAGTGNVERADLNNTFLQPFLAHQFPGALTLTVQSESTYNWEADSGEAWTIPLNVLVTKVTRLGSLPFSVGGGAGYYVDSPSIGPDWKLRAVFTVILPGKK